MQNLILILILMQVLLTSCQNKNKKFVYDPHLPYPILNSGDFWPDMFDQRGLQNAIVFNDKLYCNTVEITSKSNFLYCLNLNNGYVEWRANVLNFAMQPVTVVGKHIVYCSYLGGISTFDNRGELLWEAKFNLPYLCHWVDSINSTFYISDVASNYVNLYNTSSGKLVSKIESDSLKNFRFIDIDRIL